MPSTARATRQRSSIKIHPTLAAMPMIGEHDPASKTVVNSVREVGILEPLKICKGRLVDGRLRLRGAEVAELDEVPVVEVDENEVATIILHSLLARTHFSEGVRGYIAAQAIDDALVETRVRAVERSRINTSGSKSGTTLTRLAGFTVEELAEWLGIGASSVDRGKSLAKKFRQYPKLRERWEPKLLSGEMGIGEVAQAISGKIAAIEGRAKPTDTQMLFALFDNAPDRFAAWERIPKKDREEALEKWTRDVLPTLPEEFHAAYEEFLTLRRDVFTGV